MTKVFTPIEYSSVFTGSEYDPDTQELTLTFRGGKSHTYQNIPALVNTLFLASDSKGQFFQQQIRGVYPEKK